MVSPDETESQKVGLKKPEDRTSYDEALSEQEMEVATKGEP